MDKESTSVALHTPIVKEACSVDYNETAREVQREATVADHAVCSRIDHNRNCGFSGYDHTRRSGEIGARRSELRFRAREEARRS